MEVISHGGQNILLKKGSYYHEDSLKNSLNLGNSFIAVTKSCSRRKGSCVSQAVFTSSGLSHAMPRRRKGKSQLGDRLPITAEMGTDLGAILPSPEPPHRRKQQSQPPQGHFPQVQDHVKCAIHTLSKRCLTSPLVSFNLEGLSLVFPSPSFLNLSLPNLCHRSRWTSKQCWENTLKNMCHKPKAFLL